MAKTVLRQSVIVRTLKAARIAGFGMVRFKVYPDNYVCELGEPKQKEADPLEEWISRNENKTEGH